MADQDPPAPIKRRFQPKVLANQVPKTLIPKPEPSEASAENVLDHKLTRLVKLAEQGSSSRTSKTERKFIQGNVTFGYADTRRGGFGSSRYLKKDPEEESAKEKEYEDVWNYDSYYPISLPLRLPHSGNPETLDKEEFAEDKPAYDERFNNTAKHLGLMEGGEGLIFFQFPSNVLPMGKQPSSAEGKPSTIKIGKLLVYKSGCVKLKVGDTLFDVAPGSDTGFAQDVMAINTVDKTCCLLDEVTKRAIVTPDIDFLCKKEDPESPDGPFGQ